MKTKSKSNHGFICAGCGKRHCSSGLCKKCRAQLYRRKDWSGKSKHQQKNTQILH